MNIRYPTIVRQAFYSLWFRLLLSAVVPMVLFAAAAVVAYETGRRLIDTLEREKNARQVISEIYLLKTSMEEMESAKRGHHLLGKADFKVKFDRSRDEFLQHLARLERSLGAEPPSRRLLNRIKGLEQASIENTLPSFRLWQNRPQSEGRPLAEWLENLSHWYEKLNLQHGVELSQRMSAAIAALETLELDKLGQYRAAVRSRTEESNWTILAAFALSAAFSIAVTLILSQSVTRPIDELGRAINALRQGELQTTACHGPAEIQTLIRGFNQMGVALSERTMLLQQSERSYRQLTEATLDALVLADDEGRIVLFNPAAARMFGYAPEEVIGQPLKCLMPRQYHEAHERGFKRYQRTREPHVVGRVVELRGRRKDGAEFPLELSLSAIDLGGSLQFLGAIRDLTERNRLHALVMQTEKLASIGLLSAGIAHEINNPLAYVASNLAVLERDTKALLAVVEAYENACQEAKRGPGKSEMVVRRSALERGDFRFPRGDLLRLAPEALDGIDKLSEEIDLPYIRANLLEMVARTSNGVQRVTRIVQSLRGLGRTTPSKFEEARLAKLVDTSLDMIRGRLERRGIKLDIDYGDVVSVRCIPTQLGQALLNLATNAMHAIEAAGRKDGRIRITALRTNHEILIEVADNGQGIKEQDLPRIFDPFFTTKAVGEGTGLGLAMTHSIVTGHGGRIEVASRPGAGACFRIFLPLQPMEAPHEPVPEALLAGSR